MIFINPDEHCPVFAIVCSRDQCMYTPITITVRQDKLVFIVTL